MPSSRLAPADPSRPRRAHRRRRNPRSLAIGAVVAGLAIVGTATLMLLPTPAANSAGRAGSHTVPASAQVASRSSGSAAHGHSHPQTASDGNLPPLAAPSAASPLRVLEIGDSLGIDLGDQLQTELQASGVATMAMDSVGDTGLSNTSFYDWPAHLLSDLSVTRPQILVVFLGANDWQGFYVGGVPVAFGSSAWLTAYRQRVDTVIQESTNAGCRVVWVGMPPMADPGLDSAMSQIDGIYQQEAAKFPGALYLSSRGALATPAGAFLGSTTIADGSFVALRTPDGVHLTYPGATLLGQAVITAIDQRWHLTLKG